MRLGDHYVGNGKEKPPFWGGVTQPDKLGKKYEKETRTRNRIWFPRRPVFCPWINAIKGSRQSCCVSSADSMAPKTARACPFRGDCPFVIRFPECFLGLSPHTPQGEREKTEKKESVGEKKGQSGEKRHRATPDTSLYRLMAWN